MRLVSLELAGFKSFANRTRIRFEPGITGIVGPNGGYTHKVGDEVIRVPVDDPSVVTPHTEAFQAVIWHCIVCHPDLMMAPNKWEQITHAGEKKGEKQRRISR